MTEETLLTNNHLQRWLQDMIVSPVLPGGDAVPQPGAIINASARLSATQRLGIYRSSYIARLRECMRSQFSALAYALGQDLFNAFADDYLARHPSRSYTLNDLGERFADFLRDTRPDTAGEESWPDFMIELADFEFALSAIFDEHRMEHLPDAGEDTPNSELSLRPVLHLFRHSYPVCRYYLDHTAKTAPVLPLPGITYCVVNRVNYRLGIFELKPAQYFFLSQMKNGIGVADALLATRQQFDLTRPEMKALWKEWRRYFHTCGFFVRNAQ